MYVKWIACESLFFATPKCINDIGIWANDQNIDTSNKHPLTNEHASNLVILVIYINSNRIVCNDIHINFKEKELQVFCDARHKVLYYNDNGKMIRCHTCCEVFTPVHLVDNRLQQKLLHYGLNSLHHNTDVGIIT